MYKKRLLIFLGLCSVGLLISISRLSCMSFDAEQAKVRIEEMKILPSKQTPTVRGDIYDRKGKPLAKDEPQFYVGISYNLTKLLDERYLEAKLAVLKAKNPETPTEQIEDEFYQKLEEDYINIDKLIEYAARIKDTSQIEIEEEIDKINDRFWRMREFFAWFNNYPKSQLRLDYAKKKKSIPVSAALEDYRNVQCPDGYKRLKQILKVDLREMHQVQALIELDEEQKNDAQIEFMDTPGISVMLRAKRLYKYGKSASQIIGWVGQVEPAKDETFTDDKYSRYLSGEVAGKNGVEYICEPVLRGQRGTTTYTRYGQKIEDLEADPEFGRDVTLTIDIELQKAIEDYLQGEKNLHAKSPMGAVVIDVKSNEILAMVSLPYFDLNTARSEYGNLLMQKQRPLESKAMVKIYPPGSSVKPLILIMALEEHMVTASDIIHCECHKAPRGWPSCWIFRQAHACHDVVWQDEGGNNGRNAIRGSCNIYFSRVADMMESETIQNWLYSFGYGRKILAGTNFDFKLNQLGREHIELASLRESAGQISTKIPLGAPKSFDDITELIRSEKRMFGIGEGGLRVTVLQVANAYAAIGRGGIFKNPKLFVNEFDDTENREELTIKQSTLDVVRDGMSAVVYERGGTAYTAFVGSDLDERDVKVYGKTGSTQGVPTAWFAGFAEDSTDRSIAIAIVVEGGVSGSRDAAPLGRRMIELANEYGYIGKDVAGNYGEDEVEE